MTKNFTANDVASFAMAYHEAMNFVNDGKLPVCKTGYDVVEKYLALSAHYGVKLHNEHWVHVGNIKSIKDYHERKTAAMKLTEGKK